MRSVVQSLAAHSSADICHAVEPIAERIEVLCREAGDVGEHIAAAPGTRRPTPGPR